MNFAGSQVKESYPIHCMREFNWVQLVLATVQGYPAAVRVWNRTGLSSPGCYPGYSGTYRVRGQVRTGPRFPFTVPTTFGPMNYLSSHHIMM